MVLHTLWNLLLTTTTPLVVQRYHETRKNDILICACKANESLPMNPNLPADLLTSCLTTPIRMALEWYFRYGQKERLLSRHWHRSFCRVYVFANVRHAKKSEV